MLCGTRSSGANRPIGEEFLQANIEHGLTDGGFRPKEFTKNTYDLSDSEDDSNVGKMPPSDSEDE